MNENEEIMRDPARIGEILGKLEKAWRRVPDQRLGQLLVNIMPDRIQSPAIFYKEDDEWARELDEFEKRSLEWESKKVLGQPTPKDSPMMNLAYAMDKEARVRATAEREQYNRGMSDAKAGRPPMPYKSHGSGDYRRGYENGKRS